MHIEKISQDLLTSVRSKHVHDEYFKYLAMLNLDELSTELSDDDKKKAFWINIYNAYCRYLLKPNPKVLTTRAGRIRVYNKKAIILGGLKLSLHDIEHNMLRSSKAHWKSGHLPKLYTRPFERSIKVKKLDPRIHFALNRGTSSCPPLHNFSSQHIDSQLEEVTTLMLGTEVDYNPTDNYLILPRIFNWYSSDFGGKKGIVHFVSKHKKVEIGHDVEMRFKEYNWEAHPELLIPH
jgi:hypothetical protein